ncbi:OTUlike cysteine protease family protein [Acanthamoeba castellanii str. Neff]|uniref:OTUlike cysteine protease family protein n=1 Tax=Acanthamoeba castellanii (strain ATCC 30010 / Neff) TaxID=1257118 RepID=L8HHG7_ACACF|nr:OTUlike cysteine protease family protein [Acanthamoeba castellanii str. Neff]ELR24133.1 OTUlike cysteine protease family protein [Acanthamoeba castellanii str. Neff]
MAVNTANDEAIARAVAQSEQVASADAISIGRRFDRKIRRVLHRVKEGMADEVSAIKDAFRPRVNTFNSFEENDEYLNGKQLLKKRLDLYTLAEYSVSGNGDCQFASLADQLYRTTGMAAVVRHTIVNYLRSLIGGPGDVCMRAQANAERFRQYVPGDYTEYCNTMDKRGTWGDHITLQAAANVYGVEIHLLTSYKDTVWMEIKPQDGAKTQKSLWLSFLAELHYNSLYSRQDLTSRVKAEEELRRSYASQDQAASSALSAATSAAAAPAEEGNGPPVLADGGHHHCLLM